MKRFGWLFKKHTAEHYKYYLMSVAVLIGIMTLFTTFLIFSESEPFDVSKQTIVFIFLLLATGTIFTSTVFAHLGDKRKAIATLTLPASHFEKYLVGWLYSYVLFQLVFIGCYYLVLTMVLPLDDWKGRELEYMSLFDKNEVPTVALILFLFLHSLTFWGSIFFEKWHFIKTTFVFLVVSFGVVLLNTGVWKTIIDGDIGEVGPFENVYFMRGEAQYLIRYPHDNELLMALALIGTALFIWAAAYFRLREKEV